MIDYIALCDSLRSLVSGVPHVQANLANASALLYNELPDLNWAGFYLFDGEKLVLNSFQGKPACIEIPMSRGVCGAAASGRETLVVPDVHAFPDHIACDSASKSEIVIPLVVSGRLFGVFDIDSPILDRFDGNDKAGLERFAKILCEEIEKIEKENEK